MSKNSRASTRKRRRAHFRLIFFNIKIFKIISLLCSSHSVIKGATLTTHWWQLQYLTFLLRLSRAVLCIPPLQVPLQCGAEPQPRGIGSQGTRNTARSCTRDCGRRVWSQSVTTKVGNSSWHGKGWLEEGDRNEPTAAQMLHSLSHSQVAGAAPATRASFFHLTTEIPVVQRPAGRTHCWDPCAKLEDSEWEQTDPMARATGKTYLYCTLQVRTRPTHFTQQTMDISGSSLPYSKHAAVHRHL